MSTEAAPLPGDAELRQRSRWPWLIVAGVLGLVVAVLVGVVVSGMVDQAPDDDSTEAGFARDMQTHHAQAVEMAFLIRDRTEDPTIRAMAYDIITSQQQQMGQMYAMLEDWDLSQTSSSEPMAWMADMSMDHSSMDGTGSMQMGLTADGRMPGLASPEQLAELTAAEGVEAEVLFLELMIPHHQAGVMMAEAVLQQSEDPQLSALAEAVSTAQAAEIEQMEELLATRTDDG